MNKKTKIPEGWREAALNDVCENLDNLRRPVSKELREHGDIPYYGATGIVDYVKDYIFDEELLLVGEDGADWSKFANAAFIIRDKSWVNNHAHILRCKKSNILYLQNYLNFIGLDNYISGSTRGKLTKGVLMNIKILLPPLATQNKIAEILGTVDEEIDGVNSVIMKSEKLRNGLMGEIFSEKLKVKSEKLGKIAKVERGRFSVRPRNDPRFYGGDIPFIQTGDVVGCNGRINTYHQTLNDEGLKVSKMFKKGTIVLTIAANIGDTGILNFDSCFPDSLVGITVSDRVNNIFLEYYLRTKKEYLNSIATQSAQKNINLQKLEPMKIFLPPLDEQIKIAGVLSVIDNKILIYKKIKNNLTQLKKGLMGDLLGGEKSVKS